MNKNNEQLGIFVQIIERSKRRAIILRGHKAEDYFAYCEEVSCDVWGILTSVKEAMYEPAGFWLPDSWIKPGTSKYVQGVEVPEDGPRFQLEPQGYRGYIEVKPVRKI